MPRRECDDQYVVCQRREQQAIHDAQRERSPHSEREEEQEQVPAKSTQLLL